MSSLGSHPPPHRRAAAPPPIASPPALLRNIRGTQLLLSRLGRDEVEVLVEHLGPFAICALHGASELSGDEALQGYLRAPTEVATWVLAQPAPKACLVAAHEGRADRLRLAMRHGCEFDYYDCYVAAARATSLDAFCWLERYACPVRMGVIGHGGVKFLGCLFSGCPCWPPSSERFIH